MKKSRMRGTSGFALPTVMVAGTIMMIMFVATLATTTGIKAALDQQYVEQLQREAGEAGVQRAQQCFKSAGYAATWTSTLSPNDDCNGNAVAGQSAYVLDSSRIKTTYAVEVPSSPSQTFYAVTATVTKYRSSGQQSQSVSSTTRVNIGATIFAGKIAYDGNEVATINYRGQVYTFGSNSMGQLGNGTSNMGSGKYSTFPVQFNMPSSARDIFAGGSVIFAINDLGEVWGAGDNSAGALGNPSAPLGAVGTPVKFQLPAGVTAQTLVSVGVQATFVIGSDNNVYGAGMCTYLWSSLCAGRANPVPTPVRLELPTPNPADPNTLPTTKLSLGSSVNSENGAIVMQGGAVYTWGSNAMMQLGQYPIRSDTWGGYRKTFKTPVKVANFGDSGQPKAINVFINDTMTILSSDGKFYGMGSNVVGQLGTGEGMISNIGGWPLPCMTQQNINSIEDGTSVMTGICDETKNNQVWQFDLASKTFAVKTQPGKCLDGSNTAAITLASCNGQASQQWEPTYDGYHMQIKNVGSGLYITRLQADTNVDLPPNPHVNFSLTDCTVTNTSCSMAETRPWVTQVGGFSSPIVKMDGSGNYTFVMLQNGEVWSIGATKDIRGVPLGSTPTFYPVFTQYQLPSGVKAVDMDTYYANDIWYAASNAMVVGDDGKVYVAGGVQYGQNGLGYQTWNTQYVPVPMSVLGATSTAPKALRVFVVWGSVIIVGADNRLYTVGKNDSGQLGDGTTNTNFTPSANRYTNPDGLLLF